MTADRHFTMAALSAVSAIRTYMKEHPGVEVTVAVESIVRTDVDYAAIDFEAGATLHALLPIEITFEDPARSFRDALDFLIVLHRPLWSRFLRLGLRHIRSKAGQDIAQCFRPTGIMDEIPSPGAVAWWDGIVAKIGALRAQELMVQARRAEQLSLEHERARLKREGIQLQPQWTALEDNTAGYDILSYMTGASAPVNKLIEVKSTTADPPKIILTRSEWNRATLSPEAYAFHFWDMGSGLFYERQYADVEPHIPSDRGSGSWSTVDILLKHFGKASSTFSIASA